MDSKNGVASCKRSDWRLLDKSFESKSIKRGVKILFQQLKEITWTLKALIQEKVFSNLQQQLHYSTHLSKSIHLQETKQYRPGSSHEERKRRLVETIPQDTEGSRDNDWYAENGKRYQEDGRRS